MTRFSGTVWETEECRLCWKPHKGYSGKLDRRGVEFVICGTTGKRMNILHPNGGTFWVGRKRKTPQRKTP